MLKRGLATGVAALALVAIASGAAQAEPKTNLLHQWYRGNDAKSIELLGQMFTAQGGKWEQTPIAGHTANTIAKLRADVIAGNAPPAVQLKGPEIKEWAETGLTADITPVAVAGGWDKLVAPTLIEVMKPTGQWVAAPMNIHRINWMWASKKAMDKVGAADMPKTWDEFNAVAAKMKSAGIIPVAHGSLDWTDGTLFEIIAYGMGADFYKKAIVDLDDKTLRGPEMLKTFEQLRRMIGWTDAGMPGRTMDTTAPMMMKGEAGFYFMGDWAIGFYNANNFKLGEDYLCSGAPMNSGKPGFILNSDSVIFFKQKDPDFIAGQKLLAEIIMSQDFQKAFNVRKGSIPARMDVDLADFHPCQQLSQKDLQASIAAGTLVRSMAHNMAVAQKYKGAMFEVITEFVNNPKITPAQATAQLADAVLAQM